jgi:hypothetical protein
MYGGAGRSLPGQALRRPPDTRKRANLRRGGKTGSLSAVRTRNDGINSAGTETRPKRERHAAICSDFLRRRPDLVRGIVSRRAAIPSELLSLLLVHPLLRALRLPLCQPGTVLLSDMPTGRNLRAQPGLCVAGAEGHDHGAQSCWIGNDEPDLRRVLRPLGGGRSGTAAPPSFATLIERITPACRRPSCS